ncbi:uracil-DNA glycosylase family protein [Methylocapsa polymorpha]|uniref:Uracil-DNA glycosylase family protein n=1 Tax=Methylocapsa polymorpha TaxID=3080828 RepID=A0ABZ0HVZ4_9HYPH|nr:uracil-DNA glycosylase family protein [Methylocapsa sp. RX1]
MTDRFLTSELAAFADRIRACRLCLEAPRKTALPHEPRPVLRVSSTARLLVASQAPGVRVHATGLSFNDASGDRLRQWMGVSREAFYDEAKVAIVPMGFCFPGHDAHKGDLPPRPECRDAWHDELFRRLPQLECVLAIGRYAQDYHFQRIGRPLPKGLRVDDVVRRASEFCGDGQRIIALPHPSWRNSGWIKRNPWFEVEVLPMLRAEVARAIG